MSTLYQPSIFISYSRADALFVTELEKELVSRGFQVWIDRVIPPGKYWFGEVTKAIRDSTAIVVVMTPEAESSEWVRREILVGMRESKPILPLLLRGGVFDLLVDVQYVNVTDGHLPQQQFYNTLAELA